MRRRPLLLSLGLLPLAAWATTEPAVSSTRTLVFPRDFGAHPATRTEWWYATGWLAGAAAGAAAAPPACGFQVTFFRSSTEVDAAHPSRFAASQLIFAHAAVTDLARGRLRHDQRIARSGFGIAGADEADTGVALRGWRLQRSGAADASRYQAQIASDSAGFGFDLQLATTQPLLLQGVQGFSRKGPQPAQASHYYSQPQLDVSGTLRLDGTAQAVRGRAWLDHEWSDALLDPQAVGWDWIGMNLADGSALTAFRLRRADGSMLYAGGSFRTAGGTVRNFAADAVRFTPGRRWVSAATRANYPVQWTVQTPTGRYSVLALLDDQELDSRGSTGSIYWEGLAELRDDAGRPIGHGYLEMTGYASPLRL
jgi:predicted secreted hydrolase